MVDNYGLWAMHDAEQEAELAKLPVCVCCGEHIQAEEAVCIDGDWYCEDCEDEAWDRIRNHYLESIE